MEVSSTRFYYDRAYLYLLFALIVTLAGFLPTYIGRFETIESAHHYHGFTALLWMIILVVQPWLYAKDKIGIHKIVGRSTIILVPLVIYTGLKLIGIMLSKMALYPPNIPYQLAFIDFYVLISFALFYILGLVYRKDTPVHSRLMVSTVFGPLVPGMTRLFFNVPGVNSFAISLNITYIILEIVIILLMLDDRKKRRANWVYPALFVSFVVQHLLMNYASGWELWRNWMDAYLNAGIF